MTEQARTVTYAKKDDKEAGTAVSTQQRSASLSEQFTRAVISEINSGAAIAFTPHQKKLAQHLFVKIDDSLQGLEIRRLGTPAKSGNTPITWENVNMEKLAIDAAYRIDLGLDALIPNHIHVIPYFNSRKKKYDLDLRVGYAGKDYYYRQMAVETPEDIRYELVCENDDFLPKKKSIHNDVESYEFEVTQPFKRGAVIGGFGYIVYKDAKKNKLILVSNEQFEASAAKGNATFWKDYPDQMKWKKVVTATVTKLPLDPDKISVAFMAVEAQEDQMDAAMVGAEIAEVANTGPVLEIAGGTLAPTDQGQPVPAPETSAFEIIKAAIEAAKTSGELVTAGRMIDGPEGVSLTLDEHNALKALGAKILADAKAKTVGDKEESRPAEQRRGPSFA
jgi:recombination protein RecT